MRLITIAPQNRYTTLEALSTIRPSVQRQLDSFGSLLIDDVDAAIDRHRSASALVEDFNADLAAARQLPLPPGARVLAVEPVALPVLA